VSRLAFTLLAACAADPKATPPGHATPDLAAPAATSHCSLYYFAEGCDPSGQCPRVLVEDTSQSIAAGAYPRFATALGAQAAFIAEIATSPKALADATWSTSDGFYTLTVHDQVNHTMVTSESELDLDAAARFHYAQAGYLSLRTTTFSYAGRTYDHVEVTCYVQAN
jgi:hypothetical protein